MNILYPALAMFLLTAAVYVRLVLQRVKALKSRQVDVKYYTTFQGESEPAEIAATARQISNLFEQPVLFYVILLIAQLTAVTGITIAVLAWVYVALRAVHAIEHLGRNRVTLRFKIFLASFVVLVALWLLVFAALIW